MPTTLFQKNGALKFVLRFLNYQHTVLLGNLFQGVFMFHEKEFKTFSYLSEDRLYRSFKPRDLLERIKSAIKFMLFGIFGLVIHFLFTYTLQLTAKN